MGGQTAICLADVSRLESAIVLQNSADDASVFARQGHGGHVLLGLLNHASDSPASIGPLAVPIDDRTAHRGSAAFPGRDHLAC